MWRTIYLHQKTNAHALVGERSAHTHTHQSACGKKNATRRRLSVRCDAEREAIPLSSTVAHQFHIQSTTRDHHRRGRTTTGYGGRLIKRPTHAQSRTRNVSKCRGSLAQHCGGPPFVQCAQTTALDVRACMRAFERFVVLLSDVSQGHDSHRVPPPQRLVGVLTYF